MLTLDLTEFADIANLLPKEKFAFGKLRLFIFSHLSSLSNSSVLYTCPVY